MSQLSPAAASLLRFSLRGSASPLSLPPFLNLIRFVCNLTVPAPALTPLCLAAALDPMYYSPLRKWDLNPLRVGEGGWIYFNSSFFPPSSKEEALCKHNGNKHGVGHTLVWMERGAFHRAAVRQHK